MCIYQVHKPLNAVFFVTVHHRQEYCVKLSGLRVFKRLNSLFSVCAHDTRCTGYTQQIDKYIGIFNDLPDRSVYPERFIEHGARKYSVALFRIVHKYMSNCAYELTVLYHRTA